jgi:hypothetical protein
MQLSKSPSRIGRYQQNYLIVNQWLSAGTYVVALSNNTSSDLIWWFGTPMTTTPGSVGNSDLVTWGTGYDASFLPASNFQGYSLPFNFVVHDSAVPEPATGLLLLIGLAAVRMRRR